MHTKGPWEAVGSTVYEAARPCQRTQFVARTYSAGDRPTEEDEANAKLIASALLLLDAAEWAFNLLQALEEHRFSWHVVSMALNDEGRRKWAEYVKAIRQVDPNEPLLPRER